MGMKMIARSRSGFSLIELIIVIAVIGIMAALIVTMIANASQDTKAVLARQQQAVVQEALNAWVAGYSLTNGLVKTRDAYNGEATDLGKFELIKPYLNPSTVGHFVDFSDNGRFQSEAMVSLGQKLTFSDWQSGGYPTVSMGP